MSDQTAGLCRIAVRAPGSVVELGVPTDVPLAELLPVLVEYAGGDLREAGLEHGGWTLQRLGGAPLDENGTAETLGLADGTTLYLRARHEALPAVDFDDVVDGMAETLADRRDGWRPELSRRLLLGFTLTALAAALFALLLPGAAGWRAAAAALLAVLLTGGAATASRAVGDAAAGAVLGAAVPFLALAGALVPAGSAGESLLGPRLLAAGAAAAGAAVLALGAVGTHAPLFLAGGTVAVFTAVWGALVTSGVDPVHTAGWTAVATVLAGGLVPGLAFRLAGLRLPPLPSNAAELQEGIDPYPAARVRVRAERADGYLNALHGALGLVAAACATVLLTAPERHGPTAPVLGCVLGVLLLLHVRTLGGLRGRLTMALPGAYALALAACVTAVRGDLPARLLVVGGVVVLAAVAVVASWTVPGRRLVPYWGRAADLLHTFAALSLLPLAALLAGVFGQLRAIRG
ncbi:type VII secretion integral membrane protein EccD [Streptomyces griseoviridis]|uniref:type VII secretion integral membrane protein EccD n=1 Tax=Streptomyces griseoviridis TaxID=45398 RepID=UPI0027E4D88E|nr:type VII secretion integral membrane protein EccD [Streptomyces niveoruber]